MLTIVPNDNFSKPDLTTVVLIYNINIPLANIKAYGHRRYV